MSTKSLRDSRRRSKQRRFLACFSSCAQIREAARRAKIHRDTHYNWLKDDPDYRACYLAAEQDAMRMLEDEAYRRAKEGVRRPVLWKGKPVRIDGKILYEHAYSDTLMVLLLKAHNRRKYGDSVKFEWDGDPDNLTDEQLEKFVEWFLRKAIGDDPAAIETAKRNLLAGKGLPPQLSPVSANRLI